MTALPPTPDDILLRALRARDELRYAEVVELCDTDSLEQFVANYRDSIRPMSLEDLRRNHPAISEADAPLMLARFRAALGDREQFLPGAVGVSTYEELSRLSAREFGRRWLEGNDYRIRLLRLAPESPAVSAYIEALSEPRDYVISERTPEGEDGVLLGYDTRHEGEQITSPESYERLHHLPGVGWRLQFHARLLGPAGAQIEVLPDEIAKLLGVG